MSCTSVASVQASGCAHLRFHHEDEGEAMEEAEQELDTAADGTPRYASSVQVATTGRPEGRGIVLLGTPPPRPRWNGLPLLLGNRPVLATPMAQCVPSAAAACCAGLGMPLGTPEPSVMASLGALQTPSPLPLPPRTFRKGRLFELAPQMPEDKKASLAGDA